MLSQGIGMLMKLKFDNIRQLEAGHLGKKEGHEEQLEIKKEQMVTKPKQMATKPKQMVTKPKHLVMKSSPFGDLLNQSQFN